MNARSSNQKTIERFRYPVAFNNTAVDSEGIPYVVNKAIKKLNEKGKIPSNVFHFPTACSVRGKKHPAVFHIDLPTWFIKALTDEGDIVLDPFVGTGTTCLAAKLLNRKYIGIEKNPRYHEMAVQRVNSAKMNNESEEQTKQLIQVKSENKKKGGANDSQKR
jgi:DNA modification methylase